MAQKQAAPSPTNRVTPEAFDRLRTTKLDLAARIARRLPPTRGDSAEATANSLVAGLQAELGQRLGEVNAWDRGQGIPGRGRKPEDLTLANATSWAVWEQERTLLPLGGSKFEGRRTVHQETHSDVEAADPRWADLRERIHADVFFISINWGNARAKRPVDALSYRFDADFLNFHEHAPRSRQSNDMLRRFQRFIAPYRDAAGEPEDFCAQHLWGGYFTDLYKGIPTPTQAQLATLLGTENKQVVLQIMLELLEEELEIVEGPAKPVLACIGGSVLGPVRGHFAPKGYEVLSVPHWSGANARTPIDTFRAAFEKLDVAVAGAKAAASKFVACGPLRRPFGAHSSEQVQRQ